MLKRMRIIAVAAAAVLLGWATTAPASQRTYVWTEEYGTLAKGNAGTQNSVSLIEFRRTMGQIDHLDSFFMHVRKLS